MNSINNILDWFDKNYELETQHSKGTLNHFIDHFKEKASKQENTSPSLDTKTIRSSQEFSLSHLMDGQKRLDEIYLQVKMLKEKLQDPKISKETLLEQLNQLQTESMQIKLDQMENFFASNPIPKDKKDQEEINAFISSLVKTGQMGTQTFSPLVKVLKNTPTTKETLFLKNIESFLAHANSYSLLHLAIAHKQPELAKYMIEKGVDLDKKNPVNLTPLQFAIQRDQNEIVKLLIEKGAKLNDENLKQSNEPLNIALEKNNFEIAKLLIEKGCDVLQKNAQGKLPIHIAIEKNQKEIVQLLLKRSPIFPLHYAATVGNLSMIQFFLENGSKLNQRDSDGMMPLHHAALHGHLDIAEFLIKKGALYNKKDSDGFLPYQLILFNHPKKLSNFLEFQKNAPKQEIKMEEWGEDKMEAEFASLMEKCRKAEKTVFEDTDLLIFPNTFPVEKLPLNGIKDKDFEQLLICYQEICQNKTKFSIEGNTAFKEFVFKDLKKLMTRPIGREIVQTLLENPLRKSSLKKVKRVICKHPLLTWNLLR